MEDSSRHDGTVETCNYQVSNGNVFRVNVPQSLVGQCKDGQEVLVCYDEGLIRSPPKKKINCMKTPVKPVKSDTNWEMQSELARQLFQCSPFKQAPENDLGVEKLVSEDCPLNPQAPFDTPYELSPVVHLSGFADKICLDILLRFLKNFISQNGLEATVLQCCDTHENSVIVLLDSPASATKFVEVTMSTPFVYLQQPLTCEQVAFSTPAETKIDDTSPIMSRNVKLTNFDCQIYMDFLQEYLKDCARQAGLDLSALQRCEQLDDTSVILQFDSPSNAGKFVDFSIKTPPVYMFKPLKCVQQVESAVKEQLTIALSSKVMVAGLPTPLVKNNFICAVSQLVAAVVPVGTVQFLDFCYDPNNNSGVMMFNTSEAAAKVVTCGLVYEGKDLSLSQMPEDVMSSNVKLSEFGCQIFMNFLNQYMVEYVRQAGLDLSALQLCEQLDDTTVILQFDSPSNAGKFVDFSIKTPPVYMHKPLTCVQLVESAIRTKEDTNPMSLLGKDNMSANVKVTDFDCQIYMDFLQDYLKDCARQAGLDLSALQRCEQLDDTSVILQFDSPSNAGKFVDFSIKTPPVYMHKPLQCVQLPVGNSTILQPTNTDKFDNSKADNNWNSLGLEEDLYGDNYEIDVNRQLSRKDGEPVSPDGESLYQTESSESDDDIDSDEDRSSKSTPLKSDKTTQIFLQTCLHKMVEGKFTASRKVWASVAEDLRGIHHISVYTAECQTRWRSLSNRYRTEIQNAKTSTWKFRFDMALLKNQGNIFGRRVPYLSQQEVCVSPPLHEKKKCKPKLAPTADRQVKARRKKANKSKNSAQQVY